MPNAHPVTEPRLPGFCQCCGETAVEGKDHCVACFQSLVFDGRTLDKATTLYVCTIHEITDGEKARELGVAVA